MFTLIFTIYLCIVSIINDVTPEHNKHRIIKPALVGVVLVLAGLLIDLKIIL